MPTIDIEYLQDTFKLGYDSYKESRDKAKLIEDMFHNRHYTDEQIALLEEIGQPKETFNIIKLFTRQLIGYYSTLYNTIRVEPTNMRDIPAANILNSVLKYVDYDNDYNTLYNSIKQDGFLSGLFIQHTTIVDTGKVDTVGNKIYEIKKRAIPSFEVVLDPYSRELDYSDAEYIHRFKWLSSNKVEEIFGKAILSKLEAEVGDNNNHLDVDYNEVEDVFNSEFTGIYKNYDSYLIVHTVIRKKDRLYSIYWCDDVIIAETDITSLGYNPYTVVKLTKTRTSEYYGVFNDVYESQFAINQALLQIQFLVNTNRTFVNTNAVEDFEEFKQAYNRVNSIVEVLDINGIRIDTLNADIQQQYLTIDRAFDRIQKVLGINDSFLGMAFASDSGKKVQLQKNSTVIGLKYLDDALKLFFKIQGETTLELIKKFYRANQIFPILDGHDRLNLIEINKPLRDPLTGQPFYEEILDKDGLPIVNEYGNYLVKPIIDPDTEIKELDIKLFIQSINVAQEDEKAQMLIETIVNGSAGQMLMSVNPGGYARITAMSIKMTKTKYSPEIARIFEETANMLSPQPHQQQFLGAAGGRGSSQVGGLPNRQTYTNRITGEA